MVAPVRLVARCRLSFYLESGKTLEWHSPPFGLRCSLFRVPSPPQVDLSDVSLSHSLSLSVSPSVCVSSPCLCLCLSLYLCFAFSLYNFSCCLSLNQVFPCYGFFTLSSSRHHTYSHSHRNSTGDRIIHLYEDLKSEVAIEALCQFLLILQLSNFVSC